MESSQERRVSGAQWLAGLRAEGKDTIKLPLESRGEGNPRREGPEP